MDSSYNALYGDSLQGSNFYLTPRRVTATLRPEPFGNNSIPVPGVINHVILHDTHYYMPGRLDVLREGGHPSGNHVITLYHVVGLEFTLYPGVHPLPYNQGTLHVIDDLHGQTIKMQTNCSGKFYEHANVHIPHDPILKWGFFNVNFAMWQMVGGGEKCRVDTVPRQQPSEFYYTFWKRYWRLMVLSTLVYIITFLEFFR